MSSGTAGWARRGGIDGCASWPTAWPRRWCSPASPSGWRTSPAPRSTASHAKAKTVKVSTATISHVGTVLTTASGLTLYRFTEDPAGMSVCTGACAKIWPPLTAAKGEHVQGPKGVKGLSVINVGHGRWQVAFHKVALYRFAGDTKKGQAHGQGVGTCGSPL